MMGLFCKQSFLLVFVLMFTGACSKDQTKYMVEICDVKESGNNLLYLLSDAGRILYPSSSRDVTINMRGQRFCVTYIELEGDALSDGEAVVEIKDMLHVLVKDVVDRTLFTGTLNDPVWLVGKPWFGGDYLNFEFSYHNNADSDIEHNIELVQDSIVSSNQVKKIYMTFGHNANNDASLRMATAFFSFPTATITDIQNADSLIIRVLEGDKQQLYRLAAPEE
ncbi:MAG: NigD-like C-terminal domain-containing protein [Bacteroidales bacterium]|nr:NigD-like C-terminal domain-containing protein [Bacteroidales bacterium]